jgi:hypothetical protein
MPPVLRSAVRESRSHRSLKGKRHLLLTQRPTDAKSPHTNIGPLNRRLRCPESQSNVFVPSSSTLAGSARLGLRLGVEEDMRLLLESALRLHGEFGGHVCGCGMLSK